MKISDDELIVMTSYVCKYVHQQGQKVSIYTFENHPEFVWVTILFGKLNLDMAKEHVKVERGIFVQSF